MPAPPKFFGIHAAPPKWLRWLLTVLPFALLLIIYGLASDARQRENPSDKLLPPPAKMLEAMHRAAFEENARTGEYQLWTDTGASLRRIGIGLGAAAFCGLVLGLVLGLFAGMEFLLLPFVTFLSIIPPLAVLPILFIVFGVDELAKVMLIFIGTFPVIARDIQLTVKKIPREQIIKACTLGASQLSLACRIVLPQIMPRLIETVRMSLGPAWLFLIASEAIAATNGLGYRIFLVRRYLAMDIIIPYVLWIALISVAADFCLRLILRTRYAWYLESRE
uniref:ABC transporter permease n=1 Tax=Candidatus Electronema sp. TaxID=2698783 RepID=UPI0040569791